MHNRVESIERAAARLRELVPEARIAIAHGQMSEHPLEQVIVDFWEKRFDVLVCTTIVETGLDISNANTLIVERADLLGLSQLHQLRGRVGRGRERAYAYFLYPPEKPLTETAHDRLPTIAAHTDLGAGMQVAMKDLEIRGAGNLLGGEQSGHIAGVGFDLYVRHGRRGGRRLPAATSEEELRRGQDRAAGRRAPAARLRRRASGCGSRRTARSPTIGVRGPARRRCAAELVDRYGAAARAGRQPARGGAVPAARPRGAGSPRSSAQGNERPVRPGGAAGVRAAAAQAAVPGLDRSSRPCAPSWCRGRRPRGSAASRCATPPCCTGPRVRAGRAAGPGGGGRGRREPLGTARRPRFAVRLDVSPDLLPALLNGES